MKPPWLDDESIVETRHIVMSSRLYTLSKDIIPKEKLSHFANILDISTKPAPLYSPSPPPSYEQNTTFLATLLAELSHLCVLFIPQPAHTAG